jgi:hypothetical protein
MPTLQDAIDQIDSVLERAKGFEDGLNDPLRRLERRGLDDPGELVTISMSAIERLTPPGSSYRSVADNTMRQKWSRHGHAGGLLGVLRGLRADLEAGYLTSVVEEAHGEVFADLIEMAEHLLSDGYVDPAAVTVGSALEAHLRALAEKNGVSTSLGGKPKKATRLNEDLVKQGVYSKTEQKQVTAWQGIRNNAAHGEGGIVAGQVALMCQGVRDFIARYPA